MNEQITFSDVDDTMVDSYNAVRNAQAKAFAKVTSLDYDEAYETLSKQGLGETAEQYLPMSLDDFFKNVYKTFDPFEAVEHGRLKVFDDVMRYLNNDEQVVAISNSSEQATRNKFKALGIEDKLASIHASYEKATAKPNLYLAEQAIKELDDTGNYSSSMRIIHVGDQEYDVGFGNNIKTIHPNTVNVLIDRGKKRNIASQPDHIVKSFDELYSL